MVEVRVPATSANMGAGFDTMGIALNLYNNIQASEMESGLRIVNRNSRVFIPVNESNLIYRAIMRSFDEVGYQKKGLRIVQNSRIPVTRGLGSSSACVIGGLLAGNALSGRKLTYERILELAVEFEGHPDNAAPALYGGFCVSVCDGGKVYCQSFKPSPKLKYAVMVPNFFVATKKSRGLLPEQVPFRDATHNISRAAWLVASFASGQFEHLRLGVDDKIHQPYRKESIDGLEDIFQTAYKNGAMAAFLSGSGPTVLSVLDRNFDEFKDKMNAFFREREHKWECMLIEIDNVGAVVKCVH